MTKKIKDPLLPFLKVQRGYGCSDMHVNVLVFLVKLLHIAGLKLNYAHAKTTIPKDESIPLWLEYRGEKHHAEIAFRIDKYIVMLDFIVLREDLIKRIEHDGEIQAK